jgi:replicative DNA helicase
MTAVVEDDLATAVFPWEDDPAAVKPPEVKRYEFDSDFQEKIVALLVRDTPFAQLTDGLVRPEYFESAGLSGLVAVVNRYFAKYKKAPGDKTILASLLRESIRDKILPPDMARLAVGAAPKLFLTDVSDREYVADECATFARHQAVSQAILDSVELIDKRDFEAIGIKVRKALDTGVSVSGGSYDYGEMIKARTLERKERAAGLRPPTGITTGFAALDDYLYHKGWGRRELSVLMGGPKAGKSMAMISFGVNAIAAGYRTLYVTLEVASEIIANRIDANVSERAMMELGIHIDEVEEKVAAFMAKAAPFKIEEFPTGMMRVSDLRRLIEHYKAQGITFDLVVVDYADLMAPERVTDNVQENSKSIYVNLRGLAMQEGFALLTATQTNREGAKKAVATMTDIAEDLNKVRIADVLISINKTEEERALNQARLHMAASRNQRSGFTIKVEQNIDQAKFITKVIGED